MKKVISLILAMCIVTATAACSDSADKSVGTDAVTTDAAVEETTDDGYRDNLPDDLNFDGRTVHILTRTEAVAKDEISVEELNGDVINDAVFQRNLLVEARLGVVIDNYQITGEGDDAATKILESTVSAGSAEYDLVCSAAYKVMMSAYNGYLLNLKGLEYLDLDSVYWSQGFNEAASIGDCQYVVTGTMSQGFYRYMMVETFNKTLFDSANIEYPYNTVTNGGWTLDFQNALAVQFYSDLNGDGAKDADDQYGFITKMGNDTSINDGYWAACNLRTVSKNADNYYEYGVNTEVFSDAIERVSTLFYGEGSYNACAGDDEIYTKFTNGGNAMSNARLHAVESGKFRNMTDDYGILPMPKLSETQDSYYTLTQDQFLIYGIPLTVSADDSEIIGAFLEAFASESYRLVRPAYYEIALTSKYMNDAESVEMLNIASSNVYIDPAVLYLSLFSLNVNTLRSVLASGTNTMASKIAAAEKGMLSNIEKLNDTYSGLTAD